MSKYSLHINQFLQNSLNPEIATANLRLASAEEFGYNSPVISGLRKRMDTLLPVYDFLSEYVDGDEECDWSVLQTLMSITGLQVISQFSPQAQINSPVVTSDDQTSAYEGSIFVFVDSEKYDGSLLNSRIEHSVTFIGPASADKMIKTYEGSSTSHSGSSIKIRNHQFAAGSHQYIIQALSNGEVTETRTITLQFE